MVRLRHSQTSFRVFGVMFEVIFPLAMLRVELRLLIQRPVQGA